MFDLSLYLVTDRSLTLGRDMVWIVEEAVKGGVTMVQLREKNCSTSEFIELALWLKQTLAPYKVPLIINDRIDVALAVDADGVHLGQSDMPYFLARQQLGYHKIIGLSVENMEQVHLANAMDVDYIGISPIFSTPTKTDTAQPFGLEGVKQIMAISKHKAVAIGGINLENTTSIIEAGAHGVAVVSAICSAKSPREAALRLKDKVRCLYSGCDLKSQPE